MEIKELSKKISKYFCKDCDYKTSRKSNYDAHILSKKHNKQKISSYFCQICDYTTNRKNNYNTHLSSVTHKNKTESKELENISKKQAILSNKISNIFECDTCNRIYKTNSGLWKHKNYCEIIKKQETQTPKIDENLIILLIKQNTELLEIIKNGTNNTTNNTNTNNNFHNKTFNLNFFLNEQCKDALNMSEFIDNIKVELCDVENTGKHGFIEGISKLLLKNLKALDKYKRPIHCSDPKRESLFIKDNDIWEKDDEDKMKLKNSIKKIASKNIKKIAEWVQQYPDCREPNSRKNDLYLQIVSNSMFGGSDEETEKNLNGVIKNIAKEVVIDKSY